MSALKYRYSNGWSTPIDKREAKGVAPVAGVGNGPVLRYSSPWPWLLALVISVSLWATIGWLVWTLV